MGVIYKITAPNGKCYVGQTCDTFKKRMRDHKWNSTTVKGIAANYNKCVLLGKAVRKHGWDNMVKEVVHVCSDRDLNRLERHYIDLFGSMQPGGYNLTTGGDAGGRRAESTNAKVSASNIRQWATMDKHERGERVAKANECMAMARQVAHNSKEVQDKKRATWRAKLDARIADLPPDEQERERDKARARHMRYNLAEERARKEHYRVFWRYQEWLRGEWA